MLRFRGPLSGSCGSDFLENRDEKNPSSHIHASVKFIGLFNPIGSMYGIYILYEPGSKLLVLGRVIQPLIGILIMGIYKPLLLG